MTTSISLDQTKRLKQSCNELTYQAQCLCQQINDLKRQTDFQIKKLQEHFKLAEKLTGTNVIPLFDQANLYQFMMNRLSKFNGSLDNLCEEKRRFELILRDIEISLNDLIKEVSHD